MILLYSLLILIKFNTFLFNAIKHGHTNQMCHDVKVVPAYNRSNLLPDQEISVRFIMVKKANPGCLSMKEMIVTYPFHYGGLWGWFVTSVFFWLMKGSYKSYKRNNFSMRESLRMMGLFFNWGQMIQTGAKLSSVAQGLGFLYDFPLKVIFSFLLGPLLALLLILDFSLKSPNASLLFAQNAGPSTWFSFWSHRWSQRAIFTYSFLMIIHTVLGPFTVCTFEVMTKCKRSKWELHGVI